MSEPDPAKAVRTPREPAVTLPARRAADGAGASAEE